MEDQISMKTALKEMKNGKVPRQSVVSAELVKALEERYGFCMEIVLTLWSAGRMPDDWQKSRIVTL